MTGQVNSYSLDKSAKVVESEFSGLFVERKSMLETD